jgi:TctA family transporter
MLPFFSRPVSAILAALTIACLMWPILFRLMVYARRSSASS